MANHGVALAEQVRDDGDRGHGSLDRLGAGEARVALEGLGHGGHALATRPFADVPDSLIGFDRWSWNGLDLWLDRPGRNEAKDANAVLSGK